MQYQPILETRDEAVFTEAVALMEEYHLRYEKLYEYRLKEENRLHGEWDPDSGAILRIHPHDTVKAHYWLVKNGLLKPDITDALPSSGIKKVNAFLERIPLLGRIPVPYRTVAATALVVTIVLIWIGFSGRRSAAQLLLSTVNCVQEVQFRGEAITLPPPTGIFAQMPICGHRINLHENGELHLPGWSATVARGQWEWVNANQTEVRFYDLGVHDDVYAGTYTLRRDFLYDYLVLESETTRIEITGYNPMRIREDRLDK